MIYGIFSGYYSDWIVEGYFNNKEDAEKWVAFKNNESGYDEYYIKELRNIRQEINEIKDDEEKIEAFKKKMLNEL